MNVTKKIKWSFIALSAVSIVIGICLIIWPQISALTLCYIFGALAVILGLVKTICYFRRDVFGVPLYSDLAFGLMYILGGILLLAHPGDVVALMPVLIGMMIVVDSLFKFQTAFEIKRAGLSGWWMILLLAALGVAIGVLLALNPFDALSALMILTGIALIADGAQNICVTLYVSKYIKYHIEYETYYISK